MVLRAGLSDAELRLYESALCHNHQMRTTAQIWNLNHDPLIDISHLVEDGQTNIDATQRVSRSATLSLFDPTHSLGFDTANPADSAVSPKYMLHKRRGIFVDALDRWVDVPVFTGPITAPTRDGDTIAITANGKEQLAQNKAWVTFTVKAGTNKALAIRAIIRAAGERYLTMAATDAVLSADVVVSKETNHWDVAYRIASGMGWTMFYDANGWLQARPPSMATAFNFRTGNGGSIRSDWQTGYSTGEVYNMVYVTGGTPTGATSPLYAHSYVPSSAPFSPTDLGRGSPFIPQYLRYDVSSGLTNYDSLKALSDKTLSEVVLDSVSVAFESLPIPHLEQGDAVSITDTATGVSTSMRMRTWSIPDSSGGTQANGFLKRVSRSKRRLRKTIS